MPGTTLEEETVDRLDGLRVEDEIVAELVKIYRAGERTPFHAGEEY